jgi:hypothetical protein
VRDALTHRFAGALHLVEAMALLIGEPNAAKPLGVVLYDHMLVGRTDMRA